MLETEHLLAYSDDPIVPDKVASAGEIEEFLAYTKGHKVSHCIVNFIGWLVDAYTYLSLVVHFDDAVVSISVCEDVLWGFTEDVSQADFKKLQKFAECCKSVVVEINPVFGYIGSEGPHTQDMRLDCAEKEGGIKYDESLFSEESLKKLFDWYINDYVKRWEHKK